MRSLRQRLVLKRREGRWVSGEFGRGCEPSTSPRVAVEEEVGLPVNFDLVIRHEFAESASASIVEDNAFWEMERSAPSERAEAAGI